VIYSILGERQTRREFIKAGGTAAAGIAAAGLVNSVLGAEMKKGEIMESCDFSRSFITFVTRRDNNARIQVEARCDWLDQKTGKSENFYLVASCKGEDTYSKGCLFLIPSYDFCMIYSSTDFMTIRTHANAERDNTTVDDNRGYYLDVLFHIKMVDAEVIESAEAVVQAIVIQKKKCMFEILGFGGNRVRDPG